MKHITLEKNFKTNKTTDKLLKEVVKLIEKEKNTSEKDLSTILDIEYCYNYYIEWIDVYNQTFSEVDKNWTPNVKYDFEQYKKIFFEYYNELKKTKTFTKEMLIRIQEIIEPNKKWIRKVPVWVFKWWRCIFRPVDFQVVEEELEYLIKYFNEILQSNNLEKQIYSLFWSHSWFESIHPFEDWNWRTWRFLFVLFFYVITWKLIFVSKDIVENWKLAYYRALNDCDYKEAKYNNMNEYFLRLYRYHFKPNDEDEKYFEHQIFMERHWDNLLLSGLFWI